MVLKRKTEHYLVRFGSRFPSFLLKFHDFYSGTVFGPELICIANKKKNGRVRYGTVRYGTLRYGTVRYGTVRYAAVRYGTVRYAAVRYGTLR